MFAFWMFIVTLALAIVPIFIGTLSMPDADRTSTVDTIIRRIVENRIWILIGWTFVMSLPALANVLREHKYQKIQAQPVIKRDIVSGREGEFTWINDRIFPKSTFGLEPTSQSSGRMWHGYTVGALRESDRVGIYAMWIYGSDAGMGHYVWEGGSVSGRSTHFGEGHVPLNYHEGDRYEEYFILNRAGARVSAELNSYCRPLRISVNERTHEINIYDPESGRDIHLNLDKSSSRDTLVFGPHPVAKSPYIIQPGLSISDVLDSDDNKQLVFFIRDVYGNPLDNARISIGSDYGYSYAQDFMSEMIDDGARITLPFQLPKVDVTVSRRGYHSLARTVSLTPYVQRVDAVLEPLRKA